MTVYVPTRWKGISIHSTQIVVGPQLAERPASYTAPSVVQLMKAPRAQFLCTAVEPVPQHMLQHSMRLGFEKKKTHT